ncbi:MAG: urease accessory protein UreE [Rhodospirillaceae bacterium]|nr:urease accessory protein UreE [Rhodospirillaceae bacterium]|tara:strand:- start:24136 stop:24582 length:447 start_codon:yes stop_codon:yes gene_type:complete
MLKLTDILGLSTDNDIGEALHDLSHRDAVELLHLDRYDMQRHRLRAETDKGTVCALALRRCEHLQDGSVLFLDQERAIVVRALEERWLLLEPRDAAAAIELGYHAGNLHWRVKFDGERLAVALEGPEQAYLDRLKDFFGDGRARRADD